jgi:hypothetical protein
MARSTAVGSNTDPLIWIRHPSITRASAINRIHAAGWWVPVLVSGLQPLYHEFEQQRLSHRPSQRGCARQAGCCQHRE